MSVSNRPVFPSVFDRLMAETPRNAIGSAVSAQCEQPTGPLYEDAAAAAGDIGVDMGRGDLTTFFIMHAPEFDHAAGVEMPTQAQGYMQQPPALFVQKDLTFFVVIDQHGVAVDVFGTYAEASACTCDDEQVVEVDGQGFVRA